MRARQLAVVVVLALGSSEVLEDSGRPNARELKAGRFFSSSPHLPSDSARERRRCEARIARLMAEPALAGAPRLEEQRADILWRAKAEPVLFLRTPAADTSGGIEAELFRRMLDKHPEPGWHLARNFKQFAKRPELARAVLLREGYLYAERPTLASMVTKLVELNHLFREPEVVIDRGARRLTAFKGEKPYYEYADGPERGQRARLLLFDRVHVKGSDPGPPIHVDVRQAQARLGFERFEVERLTSAGVVARLRYGAHWVRAAFEARGTSLAPVCELVPEAESDEVIRARELSLRRAAVLATLRHAMATQVDEALPFDEPKTEDGQQDGNLRPAWRWAYSQGWDYYKFNEDHYSVFDAAGRPSVPQVCIDFVTDTFERASGTWWAGRGAGRTRLRGRLDFEELDLPNRRSVDQFIDFAGRHPQWFDVYALLPEERVPFYQRERFVEHLLAHRDRYLPGDIVAIHGPRPPDEEMHYHSFFIYDADPVSGMPTLVAANAGRPRVRSWESEILSGPKRSIHTRVRPRLEWLEAVIPVAEGISALDAAPGATPQQTEPSLSAPG
jgi:hypothetical protein